MASERDETASVQIETPMAALKVISVLCEVVLSHWELAFWACMTVRKAVIERS